MRVSVEPARDLCGRLGAPQERFRSVHVAGSKGKGTVSSLISTALLASGIRVGTYASPHVENVCERLSLGGRPVSPEVLATALEQALEAREQAIRDGSPGSAATWFDVLTAAAFAEMARAEIELGVIECGLGGRLDSTNVVRGTVCVVTNIYLEHTNVLGDTRTAIAAEKAGIIKPGSIVVVGALGPEDEAARVIEAVADARGARSLRVELSPDEGLESRNLRLASEALGALQRAEPDLVEAHGGLRGLDADLCRRARLAGRAERRQRDGVRVVLDGAHVPASLELLLRDLQLEPALEAPPVVVLGMGLEKDAGGLLKALRGRADRVLCTSVGEGPYRNADELAALGRELGLATRSVPDSRAALDEAVAIAGTRSWVLVTGSLHLVGALRHRTGT